MTHIVHGDGDLFRQSELPCADRPPLVWRAVAGREELMDRATLGVISSTRTPPDLYLPTFDVLRREAASGTVLVGGFQSPLEADALRIFVRSGGAAIVCLARSADRVRPVGELAKALREARLLVLSPVGGPVARRVSSQSAERRNLRVVELSRGVLIPHGAPGSRTYSAARAALELGKPVTCFHHPANRDLCLLGATSIQ